MSRSMYLRRPAAERRVRAGDRFHAEQEEQTKRQGSLSRRIGLVFAEAAVEAALDSLDKPGYPAGWGTSPCPRRLLPATSPTTAATLAPPKLRNPEPFC